MGRDTKAIVTRASLLPFISLPLGAPEEGARQSFPATQIGHRAPANSLPVNGKRPASGPPVCLRHRRLRGPPVLQPGRDSAAPPFDLCKAPFFLSCGPSLPAAGRMHGGAFQKNGRFERRVNLDSASLEKARGSLGGGEVAPGTVSFWY